jgi:hypothetical protein
LTSFLVLLAVFEDELGMHQSAVRGRRCDARQGEHARNMGGQLETTSQDVQRHWFGTEDQAAARRQAAVAASDTRQEAEPRLADVDQVGTRLSIRRAIGFRH